MDEDDQLAQAIAASLAETSRRARKPQVIVIDDSDDEADQPDPDEQFNRDLAAALKASNEASSPASPASSAGGLVAAGVPTPASGTLTPASAPMSDFIAERKKLEAERLARQKRLRPDLQAEPSSSTSRTDDQRPTKRQATHASRVATARTNQTTSSSGSSITKASPDGFFWDGALRPTGNMHIDPDQRHNPDFRFTDIIGDKSELACVVLSSFSNDIQWLMSIFPDEVPIVLVNHPVTAEGNDVRFMARNWVLVTPKMTQGRGAMHIKIILLLYKNGRIRLAIPTANMMQIDWRDIENTVFVQDIPKLDTPTPFNKLSKDEDFASALANTLKTLNVNIALSAHQKGDFPAIPLTDVSELRMCWDWSKVKVKLVPSLAGRFEGWQQVRRFGHTALHRVLRELGAETPANKKLILECQGSSIGRYSTQWMNEFYCSAQGSPSDKFSWIGKSTARAKLPYPPIKILFPSLKTVTDSKLGLPGGGTMFCDRATWEGTKFPRDNFYDSNSKRGRVLMHTKMILGTFEDDKNFFSPSKSRMVDPYDDSSDDEVQIIEDPSRPKTKLAGWLYVGSHNFTPSAWGTLSGTHMSPVLNITNFELGIVLPIEKQEMLDEVAAWKRPARKYVTGQDVPWMQKEYLQE